MSTTDDFTGDGENLGRYFGDMYVNCHPSPVIHAESS